MSVTQPDPYWHHTPQEFLASWSSTRGNLRRFLEELALPPIDDETQREAGEAAAAAAVAELFDLELSDYTKGLDSVTGSIESAGGLHVTTPDPTIPQDEGVAAFFDVDNTLIQGSSLIVFAVGLAKKRYFSLSEILPVIWKQIKFRVTGSENASGIIINHKVDYDTAGRISGHLLGGSYRQCQLRGQFLIVYFPAGELLAIDHDNGNPVAEFGRKRGSLVDVVKHKARACGRNDRFDLGRNPLAGTTRLPHHQLH